MRLTIFKLLLVLLPGLIVFPSNSQTIVEVMIDQPERLGIIIGGDTYSTTDNTVVFGGNIEISGGTGPYSYSWMAGNNIIGNDPVIEIPYPLQHDRYVLTVSDENNCMATFTLIHDLTVNSELLNAGESDILIYPVPASRYLVVDPQNTGDELNVTIYNNYGTAVLMRQISGATTIDINFPPGIYIINILNSENKLIGLQKIIVL